MYNSKYLPDSNSVVCCVYFILLITFALPECSADCGLLKPMNPNGTDKDLELLKKITPLKGKSFEVKDTYTHEKYVYKVRICEEIENVKQHNVSAVQIDGNKTHILGLYNETDIMAGTDWIQISYYGGQKYGSHCNYTGRVTKIMIICDPDSVVGNFEMLEERKHNPEDCFYLFELGSSVACTSKEKKQGLSSGSVFCILFFTGILAYLVLGVLYKRIVLGAQGLDQIPNYSFWKDFGNLQADGCDFICRYGSRRESHAYRGIDDHLKDEEERDDQLLNM